MDTPVFHQNKTENLAFFVGDIHGQYDLLMEALHDTGFEPEKGHVLFSVGDLIDRGPKNMECIDLLDQPWFFAIRGNHEDFMIKTVLEDCLESEAMWAGNGGGWAAEYMFETPEDRVGGKFTEQFVKQARKLASLPYLREVKTGLTKQRLLCVHAEIPKDADLRGFSDASISGNTSEFETLMDNLIWKRSLANQVKHRMDILADDEDVIYKKTDEHHNFAPNKLKSDLVISGHTPIARKPVMIGKHLFIDTGAARGRKPTVLNETEILNMRKRHRSLEQSFDQTRRSNGPTA